MWFSSRSVEDHVRFDSINPTRVEFHTLRNYYYGYCIYSGEAPIRQIGLTKYVVAHTKYLHAMRSALSRLNATSMAGYVNLRGLDDISVADLEEYLATNTLPFRDVAKIAEVIETLSTVIRDYWVKWFDEVRRRQEAVEDVEDDEPVQFEEEDVEDDEPVQFEEEIGVMEEVD